MPKACVYFNLISIIDANGGETDSNFMHLLGIERKIYTYMCVYITYIHPHIDVHTYTYIGIDNYNFVTSDARANDTLKSLLV